MKHAKSELEMKVADLETQTSITFNKKHNVWNLQCTSGTKVIKKVTRPDPRTGRIPPLVLCLFREAVIKSHRGILLRGQVIAALIRVQQKAVATHAPPIPHNKLFDQMRADADQLQATI